MSESAVTCSAPYRIATVHEDDETVVLKVGPGDDKIEVSAVLLFNGSGYFKQRLSSRGPEDYGRPFGFPQEDLDMFNAFVNFLKDGTLRFPNPRRDTVLKASFRFLTDLFAFASRFDSIPLRNALLDQFFLRVYGEPDRLPMMSIHDVYDKTSDNSSLRDLVVTIIINIGDGGLVESYQRDVPREFLADCLKTAGEDGIVPFANKDKKKVKAWLEEKKDKMCRHYHVHEGESDEDVAMDVDMEFVGEISRLTIRY